MKNKLCFLLVSSLVGLLILSCKKLDVPKDTPSAIKKEIKKMQDAVVTNPPSSVWRYDYNGKTVFYVPAVCCDVMSRLLDENAELICHPDGGITGTGDGKCADFADKASNKKLIWQDDRK